MHGHLLDDLVGHIEEHYKLALADPLRSYACGHHRDRDCRGECMLEVAAFAANELQLVPADIFESFGRACEARQPGAGQTPETVAELTERLIEIAGDGFLVVDGEDMQRRIELFVRYRDGAGRGDIIAGWLSGFGDRHLRMPRLTRYELSPLPGCHTQFRLSGGTA